MGPLKRYNGAVPGVISELYPDAIGGISDESLSFGWGVAKDEV